MAASEEVLALGATVGVDGGSAPTVAVVVALAVVAPADVCELVWAPPVLITMPGSAGPVVDELDVVVEPGEPVVAEVPGVEVPDVEEPVVEVAEVGVPDTAGPDVWRLVGRRVAEPLVADPLVDEDADDDDDVPEEDEVPEEDAPGPDGSAQARPCPAATADPTPSATANPPTRPTYLAAPIDVTPRALRLSLWTTPQPPEGLNSPGGTPGGSAGNALLGQIRA